MLEENDDEEMFAFRVFNLFTVLVWCMGVRVCLCVSERSCPAKVMSRHAGIVFCCFFFI